MVAAGIAMSFTASTGIGDHQTARELISSGLILLGGYYYGRYKAYESDPRRRGTTATRSATATSLRSKRRSSPV